MHLWAHDPRSAQDGSTSSEKCTPGRCLCKNFLSGVNFSRLSEKKCIYSALVKEMTIMSYAYRHKSYGSFINGYTKTFSPTCQLWAKCRTKEKKQWKYIKVQVHQFAPKKLGMTRQIEWKSAILPPIGISLCLFFPSSDWWNEISQWSFVICFSKN